MANNQPRVCIGLPVYNGGEYLVETLDSILAQTYADFELIISDNASTDSTEEVCRAYAAGDPRIHYYRNEENLGAARNFNRVFALAVGEYFRWAAADDLYAPEHLERCVEILDRDPSVILCYTRAQVIDGQGRALLDYDAKPRVGSTNAKDRFNECVCVDHPLVTVVPIMIFGLIRAEILRETPLIGNYASSDGVLLGELALRGRFYEVPEFLFFYRHHARQSTVEYPNRHALKTWYDPKKAGKITFPHWRLLYEHFRSIGRASPTWQEQVECYGCLGRWARLRWKGLLKDLLLTSSVSGRPAERPLLAR